MAKLSVYIADALLERVRLVENTGNMSSLVQRALERLVAEEAETPPYASRKPAGADATLASLAQKLSTEARADYERGYADALKNAESMPWSAIERFADQEFHLPNWCEGWRNTIEYKIGARASREFRRRSSSAHPVAPTQTEPSEVEVTEDGDIVIPQTADIEIPRWVVKAGESLGSLIDPVADWAPGKSYLRGFARAWQDIWNAVEGAGHGRAEQGRDDEGKGGDDSQGT